MSDYQVLQLAPNHADHISYYREDYLNDMFQHEIVVAEPKYDGERMLIHIDGEHIYCTSRRFSKKTGRYMENQDKLPILEEIWRQRRKENVALQSLDYTVLDCECYSKDWSTIVGILHSLPDRAKELQKTTTARFAIFDCLYYDGLDIRTQPYYRRLFEAHHIAELFQYEPLHTVKTMHKQDNEWVVGDLTDFNSIKSKEDWQQCMQCAINEGFEGIVIKSLTRQYYDKGAILKCKKFETVDCVVCGYQQGRGKYEGLVGALEIGYFDGEKVIKISNVNCSTDEDRKYWTDNWDKLKNSVIEVKCQEITDRSLRHPVYIRRRDDKDYTMCTKDTIFKEG